MLVALDLVVLEHARYPLPDRPSQVGDGILQIRPCLKEALQYLEMDGAAAIRPGVVVDVLHEAKASPQQVAVRFRTFQGRLENRPRQEDEQVLIQIEPRVDCRRRLILPKPVLLLDQMPGLGNAPDQQSQDIVVRASVPAAQRLRETGGPQRLPRRAAP